MDSFLDVDLILLGYSNLVKECVVDIHNMLRIRFFFFFQMSCGCYIYVWILTYVKTKKINNNNDSEILHAHNVRQSLLHTYNITNNKNKNGK